MTRPAGTVRCAKRSRSPAHAASCGSPCCASDARHIAELEAEVAHLRDQMATLEAVLGVDLHTNKEFEALRAAQHRNGGGSGIGFLHVQHESGHRVSKALLEAVEQETQRLAATSVESVNPTALARWTMPHGVVPSLVAEHIVAPFADPDCIVTGPGAPRTALLKAQDVRDAYRRIALLIDPQYEAVPNNELIGSLCGFACDKLEGDDLRRFVEIATPFTADWPGLAFLCNWCAFREAGRKDEPAAAARVFATAWHAADWHAVGAFRIPHPGFVPHTQPLEMCVRLADLATTPTHVIAMCNVPIVRRKTSLLEISWSTEFWTNFFIRLAPKATTAAAVEALCTAVSKYAYAVSREEGLDVDAMLEFFVALLPALTSERLMIRAIAAITDSTLINEHNIQPTAFYRDFFLPLAQNVASPSQVRILCLLFGTTIDSTWILGDEVLPVLATFVATVRVDQQHVDLGAVRCISTVVKLIARDKASVGLASDMLDSVILPLVPYVVPRLNGDNSAASDLHKALTAIAAFRLDKGNTSQHAVLEPLLLQLAGSEADSEEEEWDEETLRLQRELLGLLEAFGEREDVSVPRRYGPDPAHRVTKG